MQVQVYQYVKSTNELPKIFKSVHKVNYMLFSVANTEEAQEKK